MMDYMIEATKKFMKDKDLKINEKFDVVLDEDGPWNFSPYCITDKYELIDRNGVGTHGDAIEMQDLLRGEGLIIKKEKDIKQFKKIRMVNP